MIDAARIGAEITAAMHGENLEVRMPLEDAVEDQVVQRDRGVERIADHVVEVKARETLRLGETVRVDQHQRAEFLGFLPERRESRIGQLLAVDVGEDLDALEPSFFMQRSSSFAASLPSCIGTPPSATSRSLCLPTYSAMPSLRARAACTPTSTGRCNRFAAAPGR